MTRLSWSKTAEKPYESGVSHGVLYPVSIEREFVEINGDFSEGIEGWNSNSAFGVYVPSNISWDPTFGRSNPGSLKVNFNGGNTWAHLISVSGLIGKTVRISGWVFTPFETSSNPKIDIVFHSTSPTKFVSRNAWTRVEWVWTVTTETFYPGFRWENTIAGQSVWIDDISIEVINQTPGVPWNGLISVDESYVGADRDEFHFDGIKYMDLIGTRNFRATIQAFSVPPEFGPCLGNREVIPGFTLTRQPKARFGFSYRTEYGDSDYRIHLVYNAIVTPGSKAYETLSGSQTPTQLELVVDAVPVKSVWHRPTAHYIVDSAKTRPDVLTQIENVLYGTSTIDATLPNPDRLHQLVGNLISEPISEPL